MSKKQRAKIPKPVEAPAAHTGYIDRLPDLMPFVFFGLLLLFTLNLPPVQSFDEFHYIPAAKDLITLTANRNWEHPPLAKLIMGLSWWFFTQLTGLLDELSSMRLMPVIFGLGVMASLNSWSEYFGFDRGTRRALVWILGFNMVWFVQSKTAMLDIFYLYFGLQGLLLVVRAQAPSAPATRLQYGWVLLGLAMACKWSALPFVVLALWFSRKWGTRRIVRAVLLCISCYFLTFTPYFFLNDQPLHVLNFFAQQLRMLSGLASTSDRVHSYQSAWWQWPTLLRPMWYTFAKVPTAIETSHYTVFMGGNPVVFWLGNIALLSLGLGFMRSRSKTHDPRARFILALYITPLLTWILTPRKLMFFYYILPACIWYGPAMVLALRNWIDETKVERTLWGVAVASGLVFFFMLPLLTGQEVRYTAFQKLYQWWMWRLNWI